MVKSVKKVGAKKKVAKKASQKAAGKQHDRRVISKPKRASLPRRDAELGGTKSKGVPKGTVATKKVPKKVSKSAAKATAGAVDAIAETLGKAIAKRVVEISQKTESAEGQAGGF